MEITDSLPDYSIRQYSLNRFRNGEMGVVKVSAGGYADRVTVDFGTYLDKLYKNEYDNYRGIFAMIIQQQLMVIIQIQMQKI